MIICLDSRAVDLIKTLSTYLVCSDGEYCYTRQQNPCSAGRRVRLTHFSFSFSFLSTTHSLYISLEKKNPANAVPGCMIRASEWCCCSVPAWTAESGPPEILLFFFLLYFALRVVSLHDYTYTIITDDWVLICANMGELGSRVCCGPNWINDGL